MNSPTLAHHQFLHGGGGATFSLLHPKPAFSTTSSPFTVCMSLREDAPSLAVVGVTGAVGQEFLSVLSDRSFPYRSIKMLASKRSAGKKFIFEDNDYVVEELTPDSFSGVDIALFSAGGSISKQLGPIAADCGTIVVDNSSAFRMDENVPLVIPEVNPDAMSGIKWGSGKGAIIANPNCSTIICLMAATPLHRRAKVVRMVVSTFQAASGAGAAAMEELEQQTREVLEGKQPTCKIFKRQYAFNLFSHNAPVLLNGYNEEEMKLVKETRKIWNDISVKVTATCIRVPVMRAHAESVNLQFEKPLDEDTARDILKNAPGVVVIDDLGVRVELDGSSLSFEGQNVEKVGSGLMILGVGNSDDGFTANATVDRKENLSDDTYICDEVVLQRNSIVEHHGKEDIRKEENNQSLRSSSPEGLEKQKGYCGHENEFRGRNKLLSSENSGKRHKSLGISPSQDRHHEEDSRTNRSKSHERAREGLRSQSILQEALQSHQRDAAYQTERKRTKDSDDETFSRHHRDYRHGSRDLLRDKESERSSSYSRHIARVDRHQSPEARDMDRERSRETWDGDRERREMDRDRKKENEREKVRERARERDRNREREREGERRRERDRDRSREKEYDRFSRNHKHYDVDVSYGDRDRHNDYRHRRLDETEHRDRSRKNDSEKVHGTKVDDSKRDTEKLRRDEVEQENYQERIVLQLAEHEEEEIDRIKEESRKRRQAILEKFKTQKSQQKHEPNLQETVNECAEQPSVSAPLPNVTAQTPSGQNASVDIFLVDTSFSVGKSPEQIEPHALKISGSGALGEGTPKSERLDDMFCDDIFGDSPAGVRKPGREDGLPIDRSGLHDNWDDAEGYYSYRFGEILDGRYEVIAAHGKGVFSSVVRAKDLKAGSGDPDEVAIKIIRSNDTMYKTGLEELVILKKLVGADQEDRRHCVRFLSSFKYRNHLCLVFESLHMNLREVLKKFGRNIGLKLTAIRTYAKQLFIALKHLRNCGVLHCDIKPDNMLVNDTKNVLKLCDFGNAMFAGKNEITPYLVSRFYRSPEIILGLPYDHPMDMWSVGCCLFELYTGKVLFPGPSNNDMLRLQMELKGPFPKKMLRKGAFIDQHFDQDLNFLATEEDPVTKKAIKRLILNIKLKDIGTIVLGTAGEDPKMLANFKDLLEKIFMLDPDKRITVSQALSHPFITGK